MPGFPVVGINRIPILRKISTFIFTHDEVAVSNFVVTNAASSLSAAVTNGTGLKVSAQQNLTARTVGD